MPDRGFFGPAENTLLITAYCEDHGWLRVSEDGFVGATQEGVSWLDDRDRELGYFYEWPDDSEATTNRILVHASRQLALGAEAVWTFDEDLFTTTLEALAPANAVRYDSGMETERS